MQDCRVQQGVRKVEDKLDQVQVLAYSGRIPETGHHVDDLVAHALCTNPYLEHRAVMYSLMIFGGVQGAWDIHDEVEKNTYLER